MTVNVDDSPKHDDVNVIGNSTTWRNPLTGLVPWSCVICQIEVRDASSCALCAVCNFAVQHFRLPLSVLNHVNVNSTSTCEPHGFIDNANLSS